MTFANAKEARDVINEYGVMFGYKLKFEKNETTRLRVYCLNEAGCPFQLYTSKDGNKGGLVVKTAMMEHRFFKQFSVPSASQNFLAKYFKNQVYKNPKFSVKDMQNEVENHLKIHVSSSKCKRAKLLITHELEAVARHKPIVSMLEEIRENTMARIKDKKNLCNAWFNEWSPAVMTMFHDNRNAAAGCKVIFNGASGTKFMKIDKFAPIEPPPFERMPGRRRKKRIRAFNEPAPLGSKLSGKGQLQEYSCCKSSGHNKVRCPNKERRVVDDVPRSDDEEFELRKGRKWHRMGLASGFASQLVNRVVNCTLAHLLRAPY
ncbi:hypothetical protein C2S53_006912 [Perilla frutescens var. hirtella]|uniref:Transposase MuDR plant domain-containing protein n=1 Tax=Perilla frutescens var. hirtella TaxID=608512 RepID=A0AAD4JEW2_PERFH|nr:hypothetical protein C2S53_006912 [Perilla frutescens var. hirtella]